MPSEDEADSDFEVSDDQSEESSSNSDAGQNKV
jgi:hypothetical protein